MEFDRRHDQAIGGGCTDGLFTRNIGDACERSQVSRRATTNSVSQHGYLDLLYVLRDPQPMELGQPWRTGELVGQIAELSGIRSRPSRSS